MNLLELLNVTTEKLDPAETIITIPVTDQLKQPFGLVHGGINAVLAETAASLAANAAAPTGYVAVGINVTSNHLRPVTNGTLITVATPIKLGKTIQTWDVKTHQLPSNKLTSSSIVTTIFQIQPTDK